jgi:hypothetical protein
MTEDDLRNIVLGRIQDLAQGDVLVDKEVPIPYKHIYNPGLKCNLEIWCFKQDIVFYHKLFDKSVGYKDAGIVNKGDHLIDIVLEKDNVQNSKDIGLPLVIIETKKSQPSSHEIMVYSQKAELIKSIFPYSKFIFLIFDKVSPRTYRHGINFDKIIGMPDVYNEKDISSLRETIRVLFKESKHDLNNLQGKVD